MTQAVDKIKVLIVEDNAISGEDFRRRIMAMGYDVTGPLAKGEEVYESVSAERPDVILMDIRLKGQMNGIEAAEEINRHMDIPIIFLTAHSDPDTIERAKRTEPYGYIVKPFDDNELKSAIEIAMYKQNADRKIKESRRWLETTLRSIGDGVIATDDKGRVVFMNPVAENLTGWVENDAVGSPVHDVFSIVNEMTGNMQDDAVARVLKEGIVIGLANHTLLKRKDGTTIPIADSGAPIFDDKGNMNGVVLVFRDQSEEREAQKALEESENRFRNLFINSPYGNIICQLLRNERNEFVDFVHMEANQAVHTNTGFELHQLVGKKASEIVDSKVLTELVELYSSVISTGNPAHYEQHFDVYDRTLDVTAFPLHDDFFIINFIDITERKKAEEKYRLIVENQNDLVVKFDNNRRLLFVNPMYCNTFGVNQNEILGTSFFPLIHEDDLEAVRESIDSLTKPPYRTYHEERSKTVNGWRWFGWSLKALVNDNANIDEVISVGRDITERKLAEADRERLMLAIGQTGEAVVITNTKGDMEYVNPAFEKSTGYTREEVVGRNPRILKSGRQDDEFYGKMWEKLTKGETWKGRLVNKRKDGAFFTEEAVISPVRDETGKTVNYVAVKRDITHELDLEARLNQAQKMESVGRLAGGVAHDYNNALSVIMGFTELAIDDVDPGDPLRENLNEIYSAAKRATDITRQLLAFARKQTISPEVIDLNENVEGMLKMLNRLIGEDIHLVWAPGKRLYLIKMDPSQIDQILANLCVNARDAIPGVGKVTIETSNTFFDKAYCRDHPGFVPGEFVMLAVSDNGSGMEEEILDKIFEPFFTTKGVDKGTGLGLATVYGIVKQNDGFINVYSEPGEGTTFKVYLPRHEGKTVIEDQENTEELPQSKGETVLLVEDDLSLLKLAMKTLHGLGYKVLKAGTPEEAMNLVKDYTGEIDLLLTDVIMPEMNGRELSEKLEALYPDLKCIFMSGYTANVIAHHGVLDEGVHFIQKPFLKGDLAVKVRAVLERD